MSIRRTHKPSSTPTHNLPASRSSFVGREQEMQRIDRQLAETGLLTLTGEGGSGKTRLALEVARGLIGSYPDGVWLVELAPLSEGELVPKAIADVLDVPERPQEPLTETLVDILRERRLFLVLDNCEHLVDEVARLVAILLDACPYLRVLATSREALGITHEVRWAVPTLSVPTLEDSLTVGELGGYESVRLFVDRARQRDPAFALGPDNARAVAEICARLDGLPLAIELAAARVKLLPPQALLSRLSNRLKLLTGGAKNLPKRQRTLRSTLEWSHELLDDGEKTLFARLSVFAGGRALEAIEAVCGAEGELPVDALDGVESLLDKNLLRQEERPEGEPRFVMLETIHEYAREKLEEAGEAEEVRRLHVQYFLTLAEEAEPELRRARQVEWQDRLEVEHDNMRAALSWSLGGGDYKLGLQIAGALSWFWYARGHLNEGVRWLEEALAKNTDALADARAKALWGLGNLASEQGDQERGETSLREALALYQELGDKKGVADSLVNLGLVQMFRGHHEKAKALLEEGLAAARESGDEWSISYALNMRAASASDEGDIEEANVLWEEALASARKLGGTNRVLAILSNMGYAASVQGDPERAEALAGEVLALSRQTKDTLSEASSLLQLGIAKMQGGDYEGARTLIEETLVLHRELGVNRNTAECLEVLAEVAGERGEDRRAARLWGAAEALREATDNPWMPFEGRLHQPYLVATRSRMDDADWTKAWEEGRAMSMQAAIEYALSEEEPSTSPAAAEHPSVSSSMPEQPAGLTSREIEVLGLVAEGLTNAQIAERLFLSPRTVHSHLNSIYQKLEVGSRSAATRFALEHGLG